MKRFRAANDWTIRARECCSLLSNYFDHLLSGNRYCVLWMYLFCNLRAYWHSIPNIQVCF